MKKNNNYKWESVINSFAEELNGDKKFSNDELLFLLNKGIKPMLKTYYSLKDYSLALVDINLDIFQDILINATEETKNSNLFNAVQAILEITKEGDSLQ